MIMYDVIVVGLGHAGTEAALCAAKLGAKVFACGLNLTRIASMVCNPSIGGPGKGHLVSEIDALGGFMGKNIDENYLQVRILNESKGAAVQGLRAQADKKKYQSSMRRKLEENSNIDIAMELVQELLVENNEIKGIKLFGRGEIYGKKVIVCTGVYLDSRIVLGEDRFVGGPAGSITDNLLSESFRKIGFETGRLQTATPARIRTRSIDFSKLEELPYDENIDLFSPESGKAKVDQLKCHVVRTGDKTVEAVKNNLSRSPLVIGNIVNTGPRYCPSIDRKVINFPNKHDHAIFIEPEGSDLQEIYLQGLSSAMPPESQQQIITTLEGFENCEISRFGYGIEYDYIPPRQLNTSLETRRIKNLYLAGQINGTSGYEEAAAQGLMAAINAVRSIQGKNPLILPRNISYIGVLIDDLVTKEHLEPYRMLTSRAEFRLMLSQDTAHFRLSPIAYRLGMIEKKRMLHFRNIKKRVYKFTKTLKEKIITPNKENLIKLEDIGTQVVKKSTTAYTLLKRNTVSVTDLEKFDIFPETPLSAKEVEFVERNAQYEGYINREMTRVRELKKLSKYRIPEDMDFSSLTTLSIEARETLGKFHPENMAQASRLQGITPADATNLLFILKGRTSSDSGEDND